jgi:hypothetical protein
VRKLFVSIGVIALLVTARTASAATLTFNVCDGVASLCNQLQLITTLNGSAIDVSVIPVGGNYGLFAGIGNNGNDHAFAININGSGVSISNITAGFLLETSGKDKETGTNNAHFDFLIDGPKNESDAKLPLSFTVTRSGGFQNDFDLFEQFDGYYAAAHLTNKDTGVDGIVAATLPPTSSQAAPVPEPATMVLLGSGLLAVFRARKA